MPDLEHARLLLRLARDDLAAMEVMATSPRISPSIFGFHAQQAVEKALKAWLSLLDVTYPRIHLLHYSTNFSTCWTTMARRPPADFANFRI
jgi:HEPN domain-containing protein